MRLLEIAALVCAAVALRAVAHAGTFRVNYTGDGVDANPGDGVCATPQGGCTLRAAIQEANALAGADTILVPGSQFTLSLQGADEDAGATGDLDITDDVVITGASETSTIINGNRIDRVFDVHSPAHVTLSDLTITRGEPPAAHNAGGLLNGGTLELSHVTLLQNRAGRGYSFGGGLMNLGMALLTHVTFSHNRAGDGYAQSHTGQDEDDAGGGGGLWNVGTATLIDVIFRGNRAGDGAAGGETLDGGDAGGMFNEGDATLTNVTFSSNRAGDGHKGGFNFYPGHGGVAGGMENDGIATLTNVTFEHNRAGNGGGLVHPADSGGAGDGGLGGGMVNYGTATLTDLSFSGNRAGRGGHVSPRDGGLSLGGFGGGMYNGGTVTLTNGTFGRNRGGVSYGGNGEDVGGSGGGMFDDGDGCTLTNVTMTRNQAGNCFGLNYYYAEAGSGGGLTTYSAILNNVTLATNRAGRGFRGAQNGAGNQISGNATLTNAIIFGSGPSCTAGMNSTGHNLDSGTSCGFTATGDLSATDPRLAHLKSNGGFTQTMALLPGSPAIDAGDNTACPATDQRGVTRPQGVACDIGAYEVQP